MIVFPLIKKYSGCYKYGRLLKFFETFYINMKRDLDLRYDVCIYYDKTTFLCQQ